MLLTYSAIIACAGTSLRNLMMFLCTLIHALFMIAGNRTLDWRLTRFGPVRGHFDGAVLIWLMILWMFLAKGGIHFALVDTICCSEL